MSDGSGQDDGRAAAAAAAAGRVVGGPRVIVVEDHADTLVLMGRLLSLVRADGVPVATCAAAREAARTLGRFEVVIADVTLPDGDGLSLLAEFKRAYGCRTVAVSGYDAPDGALPAGVDEWVSKPVSLAALRGAIGMDGNGS